MSVNILAIFPGDWTIQTQDLADIKKETTISMISSLHIPSKLHTVKYQIHLFKTYSSFVNHNRGYS